MLIFVDANIWLHFYEAGGIDVLEKIGSGNLAKSIYVTQQIVDEVNRNKSRIVSEKLNKVLKDLPGSVKTLASDLEGREHAKDLNSAIATFKKDVLEYSHSLLQSITNSTDAVSKALEPIFQNAQTPSPEQLERARYRKEVGNPPGKQADPLGDQISWEQLLDTYKGEELIIVTNDGDYFCSYDGRKHLNPLLVTNLREKCPKHEPKVNILNNLRDAIELVPRDQRPNINDSDLNEWREVEEDWLKRELKALAGNQALIQALGASLMKSEAYHQGHLNTLKAAGLFDVGNKQALDTLRDLNEATRNLSKTLGLDRLNEAAHSLRVILDLDRLDEAAQTLERIQGSDVVRRVQADYERLNIPPTNPALKAVEEMQELATALEVARKALEVAGVGDDENDDSDE